MWKYIVKYFHLFADTRTPFHRKLVTFLFFVLVATAFWFVRALGEQYETYVNYPVKFTNFPYKKVLVSDVPQKLQLKIQATGFSILKCKMQLKLIPLRFDVNSFALNNLGSNKFMIVTETVKDLLSEELTQVKIMHISPDTLYFKLADVISKKVSVTPAVERNEKLFKKQFTQNGNIKVVPDSVVISGPANLLKDLHTIHTQTLTFTNLTDTTSVSASLERIRMVTSNPSRVRIILPVDRFTEVEETLPVQPINVPDSLNMVAIPGKVKVTYQVCLSNYAKIKQNPLIPIVNYEKILSESNGRIAVALADTPQVISRVRFNPAETEFLITRK